jgi:hypothetical protein
MASHIKRTQTVVCANQVFTGLYGPTREEIRISWAKLCDEKLHDLYSSQHILRVTYLRMIRWAGNAAHVKEQ